jgi:WD40 repeat protein
MVSRRGFLKKTLAFCQSMSLLPVSGAEGKETNNPAMWVEPLPGGAVSRFGSTLFRHADQIISVAFSPDGKLVLSSDYEEFINLWDAESGRLLQQICTPEDKTNINVACLSPDGKSVAAAGYEKTYIWDMATKNVTILKPAKIDSKHFHAIAYSPDGRWLAVGGNSPLLIWDCAAKKVIDTKTRGCLFSALAFSADSKLELNAATGRGDDPLAVCRESHGAEHGGSRLERAYRQGIASLRRACGTGALRGFRSRRENRVLGE